MDNPLYVDLRSPYKIVCKEIRVLKKEIQGFFELKIYPSSQCTVHNMQLLYHEVAIIKLLSISATISRYLTKINQS